VSAQLEEPPNLPHEQQSFFDPTVYQESYFSVAGKNKHSTDRELEPGQQVSGRFTGAVVGLNLVDFANEKKSPSRVFQIVADYVELD